MWRKFVDIVYLLCYLLFDALSQAPLRTMVSRGWLNFGNEVRVDVRPPLFHGIELWEAIVRR